MEAMNQTPREGRRWYVMAHRVAQRHACPAVCVDTIAAVLAALSPGVTWQRNVTDMIAMVSAYRAGLGIDDVTVSAYGIRKRKAWRILTGELFASMAFDTDPQTGAFFRLIANPDCIDVCTDIHPSPKGTT